MSDHIQVKYGMKLPTNHFYIKQIFIEQNLH